MYYFLALSIAPLNESMINHDITTSNNPSPIIKTLVEMAPTYLIANCIVNAHTPMPIASTPTNRSITDSTCIAVTILSMTSLPLSVPSAHPWLFSYRLHTHQQVQLGRRCSCPLGHRTLMLTL